MRTLSETIHQQPHERIIMTLRRHPITFIAKIFLCLLLFALPFLLMPLLEEPLADLYWGAALRLLGSAYLLLVTVFFHALFIDYYLDVWIVTNDRIIDVHQSGLFKRTIAELDLKQVQDVTSQTVGFFGTFFNYGNVGIQTAGSKQKFDFQNVAKPHEIRGELLKLAELDAKEDHL
ncbi:MAG: PH domain-containing protein [Patescibacteria group bacterium]